MKYKITFYVGSEELRRFCIQRNLFTKGDNREYSKLFQMCRDNLRMTTADLIEVARYILDHSSYEDSDYLQSLDSFGLNRQDTIENIAKFMLETCCHFTIEADKEVDE